ncbi:MAG: hypothetical protein A2V93_08180 [Ignavibacteria bacterium RBG_16_34_14]|nr:MAG: hypothetical protein A2V93_08180 [Ignavibacteria bacterium RBG_16_34_14]
MNKISNNKLEILYAENPVFIKHIKNKLTGEKFCINGRQTIIIRSPLHVSDPVFLFEIKSFSFNEKDFQLIFGDDSGNKAQIKILSYEDDLKFQIKVESNEQIWLVEWRVSGFQFEQVIIPALGGQTLTKDMTPETTLSYKYPFWWNAQFVLGENKNGGMFLHTKDKDPDFKLFRVKRGEAEFELSLGFEANAPITKTTLEAEWFLDSYKESWKNPVDKHRKWLEKKFILFPFNEHPHFPGWAKNINFILEPWGMRKDQPEPHHTFEQIKKRIKEFVKLHNPDQTLLYLPGFAENGIDSHAPDYNPSVKCGGEEKFKELVDSAHKLSYKVMIHTNVLALTFQHSLYQKFKDFQVTDWFGKQIGWGNDIDGDWLPEEFFTYVNPGFKEWGDYMEKVIGNLINKFKIDAVFLDQTLLAFNVSKGPNFLAGMKDHIYRLQKTFPEILFSGEGIHEEVLSVLPFAQIHGLDSLSEIHGMEGKKEWRKLHPVSSYLFGKYTRLCAHLLTKHPTHPKFKSQENSYKKLNIIPALCLYKDSQKINIPEVKKMIERAKKLNKKIRSIKVLK